MIAPRLSAPLTERNVDRNVQRTAGIEFLSRHGLRANARASVSDFGFWILDLDVD